MTEFDFEIEIDQCGHAWLEGASPDGRSTSSSGSLHHDHHVDASTYCISSWSASVYMRDGVIDENERAANKGTDTDYSRDKY